MSERGQLLGIGTLLLVQLAIGGASITEFPVISIFCTASHDAALSKFGYVHVLYGGLFLLGMVSLTWKRGRLPYAVLLTLSLFALPMQYWLVHSGQLYCDAP